MLTFVYGKLGAMATAYIDWSDDNGDWGTTPIDDFEYSCAISSNGLHEWAYDRAACIECGGQECYCMDCGIAGCDCGRMY